MRIAEIFQSIQGEGQFAGTPSAFVRTTGCNLRCWFCDTPYTSWEPEGAALAWESVVVRLRANDCVHVVITGGEPMLQPGIVPLTHALHEEGYFVTIETAGTMDRPVQADLMSLSPKLSNSTPHAGTWVERHERLRDNRAVVRALMSRYPYQLKFVIDRPVDLEEVQAYLSALGDVPGVHVWLMPQATTREELDTKSEWIEQQAERFGYRFCPRLQIARFGNRRCT